MGPTATKNSFVGSARLVLRGGWGLPALLAVLYVLNGVLLAVELLIIRDVVDDLVAGESIGASTVLRFAAVVAVGRLSPALAADLQVYVMENVRKVLLEDVLSRAALAPLEQLETPEYQDRLVRAQASASGHVWSAMGGVLTVARGVIASLSLLAILLAVAPELVALLFAAGLLLAAVAVLRGRWQYRFEFDDTQAGRERHYLQDALVSRVEGKEIRLARSSGILLSRFRRLTEQRHTELAAVIRRRMAGAVLTTLALATALAVSLVVVSNRAAAGSLSLANAAVAVFAANQLASRLQAIANGFGTVTQSRLFVNDIQRFLAAPEVTGERGAATPIAVGSTRPSLVLEGVSYRYPGTDQDAIEHVSLRLPQGEIVALVGENGAGKTTLAKVAAGLYEPTTGTVRIEQPETGTAQGGQEDGARSSEITALFQDFARFELSVRENVWLGAPWLEPDDEAINEAIRQAGAEDFVAALPAGLDTRLGKRFGGGVELSLGQWQRLAIARTLFSDAPFMILDEPTAWLDGESATAFVSLLTDLARDRGILVISHRTDTIEIAHRQVRMYRQDRHHPGRLLDTIRPPG